MSLKLHPENNKLAGFLVLFFVLGVGFFLLNFKFRLGETLIHASYDWLFDLSFSRRTQTDDSEVVIVYLDADSHLALRQPADKPWDRTLHAQLLQRLTEAKAKAVVFDILFTEAGPDPKADQALAQAMQAHGRVILAGDYPLSSPVANDRVATAAQSLEAPYPLFLNACAGWGQARLQADADFIVREHFHGRRDEIPSLSWAAAQSLGLSIAQDPKQRSKERWVKYYGGPSTVLSGIPSVSFSQALLADGVKPDFFRNKVVFVGARPVPSQFIERRDEFRKAYSTWHRQFLFMPAVEVHATLLLNLIRGDWLSRLAPATEWCILLLTALLFGYGLVFFRPLAATGIAGLGMVATTVLALFLFDRRGLWFPWMIVAAAQIPCAHLWHVLFKSVDWYLQKRRLEQQRKQAERQIQEQAALLDKAQDAIMVHDLDWRASYWNKSAERLYGWTADEVRGQNVRERLFRNEIASLSEARLSVLDHGEWNGELRQATKSGRPIIVESRWTLVRDEAGQPASILVINTDITEKKRLEAQFLRTQRMESIGTLAGGIAHDLNNILTPVIMGAELLRMKRLDAHTLAVLETVEKSAKRGADLVKQVLTFARGHDGEQVALQLSHLIKELEKIVRETFPKSILVTSQIERDLPLVLGDATQLHQVLLNLLLNARDALPEGGEIRLSAESAALTGPTAKLIAGAKPGFYVLLTIADTGTGIPPEIIDRIFEPFFTTKEMGKGTGLGLSTVLSIVKGHQGFLEVQSATGRGTRFKIYLPVARTPSASPVARPNRDLLRGHGETILVVDDEQAIRDMMTSVLKDSGYQVLTANHGVEAIAACLEHQAKIAAVLLDMMMPIMDGPTTIKTLHNLLPHLRFIALSGLMQSDKVKEQIGLPALVFLGKPFSAEKLLETLHHVLAQSQSS